MGTLVNSRSENSSRKGTIWRISPNQKSLTPATSEHPGMAWCQIVKFSQKWVDVVKNGMILSKTGRFIQYFFCQNIFCQKQAKRFFQKRFCQ
jgi:hypothetical protein